jgi:hypothetical protein
MNISVIIIGWNDYTFMNYNLYVIMREKLSNKDEERNLLIKDLLSRILRIFKNISNKKINFKIRMYYVYIYIYIYDRTVKISRR